MSTNVGQGNFGFEKLFKNAKKFYDNTNNKKKKDDLNTDNDLTGTSVGIAGSKLPNDVNNNNNRESLYQDNKNNDETPVLNKFRNFIKRNKTKDIEDSQKFDNANPEIQSENEKTNEVFKETNKNSEERCRQEDCKSYALSNSLNSEKLKEIINDSIKAAVKNLTNDVKPPCWNEDNYEEIVPVKLESHCFNETCQQRNKTLNNKDNVKNSIEEVIPSIGSKISENICKIYENKNKNKDSKIIYNSNKNSSQYKSSICCGKKSATICHQSLSKYKQIKCSCKKRNNDKLLKPCKFLKSDNRKMTGNVNIYICSEGNEGGIGKNKKNSESTFNSMTATNSNCDCSSTEVCVCQSNTSSKTIRNLMTKDKNDDKKIHDIHLKCACGKPSTDCQCQSTKNPENEELCLCDMSSLNPTTSVETFDYNLNRSPHGDYCVNGIKSRSTSRNERECCTGQNFVGRSNNPSNFCIDVDDKSKLKKYDSGNGDTVKDFSNCDTYSDYSDNKLNRCNCNFEGNVTNPSSKNQSERYVIQNIVNYGARREEQQSCNCCKYDNESICSSGKKSEIDESVCCGKKEYFRKSYSPSRSIAYDNNNRQRWRNSDYCIVEEDNEECDKSCCKFFTPKQENLKQESNFEKASWTPCGKEKSSILDKKEEHQDNARISTENGNPPSQNVATRMSVDEIVKSFSNVDKSTSSIFFSLNSSNSPQSSPSKPKESKKSSLKWSFSKAKSFISGKSTTGDIETKNKSPITNSVEPIKAETGKEKITNGKSSSTVEKSSADEKSASVKGGNSLIIIKSSNDGEIKSKDFLNDDKKTKLSSSKLGNMIADRKNSIQSTTNKTEDSKSNRTCKCGAVDADICTCQYPHCRCCNRPEEYCKCDDGLKNRREDDKSCKVCKNSKQLCCCRKEQHKLTESENFRVCTLCCKAEKNCCCNNISGQISSRRSRTPSNFCNRNNNNNNNNNNNLDSYESDGRKSQICIYCERPRDKCSCRAPVKKCSYCGMPVDVCNCQDIETTCNGCNYEGNRCQCKGRLIDNSDYGGDQNICVTAWKPRREIRKYFSRNSGERESPDCSCCETVRPYGSDELPYQRLSVFSDVMTELQQKMNELPCCNRCEKIPCCCYVQGKKSHSSPLNENRIMCNSKQRKSRSKSPTQCRHCLSSNPCKCGGQKNSSYQICDRCRTTPCRCRKSRSTNRKPQAKCYYCKRSPCRCESIKTAGTPKNCRCSISPARSEDQSIKLIREKTEERNFQNSRINKNNCRCRCDSGRGQERRCD